MVWVGLSVNFQNRAHGVVAENERYSELDDDEVRLRTVNGFVSDNSGRVWVAGEAGLYEYVDCVLQDRHRGPDQAVNDPITRRGRRKFALLHYRNRTSASGQAKMAVGINGRSTVAVSVVRGMYITNDEIAAHLDISLRLVEPKLKVIRGIWILI